MRGHEPLACSPCRHNLDQRCTCCRHLCCCTKPHPCMPGFRVVKARLVCHTCSIQARHGLCFGLYNHSLAMSTLTCYCVCTKEQNMQNTWAVLQLSKCLTAAAMLNRCARGFISCMYSMAIHTGLGQVTALGSGISCWTCHGACAQRR